MKVVYIWAKTTPKKTLWLQEVDPVMTQGVVFKVAHSEIGLLIICNQHATPPVDVIADIRRALL